MKFYGKIIAAFFLKKGFATNYSHLNFFYINVLFFFFLIYYYRVKIFYYIQHFLKFYRHSFYFHLKKLFTTLENILNSFHILSKVIKVAAKYRNLVYSLAKECSGDLFLILFIFLIKSLWTR